MHYTVWLWGTTVYSPSLVRCIAELANVAKYVLLFALSAEIREIMACFWLVLSYIRNFSLFWELILPQS